MPRLAKEPAVSEDEAWHPGTDPYTTRFLLADFTRSYGLLKEPTASMKNTQDPTVAYRTVLMRIIGPRFKV